MFSTRKRCLIGLPIWGYQKFYSLPPKNWIFGPKTAKFGPKLAFWATGMLEILKLKCGQDLYKSVWICGMTERSYFDKQSSILGSMYVPSMYPPIMLWIAACDISRIKPAKFKAHWVWIALSTENITYQDYSLLQLVIHMQFNSNAKMNYWHGQGNQHKNQLNVHNNEWFSK